MKQSTTNNLPRSKDRAGTCHSCISRQNAIIPLIARMYIITSSITLMLYLMRHQRSPELQEAVPPAYPITPHTPSPIRRDSIEAWTSIHQVDCEKMAAAHANEPELGVTKWTNTNPAFLMSLHDPVKDDISREIYERGCWECDHVRILLKVLSYYDDAYFLDVGGNIGMWSLSAAAMKRQTFTIEPLSANVRQFCKSVKENSFGGWTHLMHIAATSEPQKFSLAVPLGNLGGTRVVPGWNVLGNTNEVVEGVPIDSLNLPFDRPVVLKIDTEGHELDALLGARRFLQKATIVFAMTELRSNVFQDHQWKEIFRVFASKGLKPYRIDDEGETALDITKLRQWKHPKHPKVRDYDVAWRRDDFVPWG
ncbi:hypothetical protein ACHAWF_002180 [Thalassiosira exigua]